MFEVITKISISNKLNIKPAQVKQLFKTEAAAIKAMNKANDTKNCSATYSRLF